VVLRCDKNAPDYRNIVLNKEVDIFEYFWIKTRSQSNAFIVIKTAHLVGIEIVPV
jgi:hypothetical protein